MENVTGSLPAVQAKAEYKIGLYHFRDDQHMFAIHLQKAAHTRRFAISDPGVLGWEVREEQDNQVVRIVRYLDWHRVERARREFAREATALRENGWAEVRDGLFSEAVAKSHYGFNLFPGGA